MKVRLRCLRWGGLVRDRCGAAVNVWRRPGDSLWLPEMVYGSLVDPFIGMGTALARTSQLKVGTGVAVLPGRHRSW